MKWRFVDKIIFFESWKRIKALKAVSLEEYYILKPLGREGILPETLLMESSLQLARWFLEKSSEFTLSFVDFEIENFTIIEEVLMGESITMEVEMESKNPKEMTFLSKASIRDKMVAFGDITIQITNISLLHNKERRALLWEGIYAPIE
ncbi:MAG: hypothetical protein H7A23_13290 [Leptospiraceae bacterium]|nr:hypothetical protein [Leptospiraceae bacterium]MCP5495524.1 hypothetical protein [Leptospiraceae bacterium]